MYYKNFRLSDNLFIYVEQMQIKERKDKKLAGNSVDTKSHLSKATTSRLASFSASHLHVNMTHPPIVRNPIPTLAYHILHFMQI